MYRLRIEDSFDAAHHLEGYKGKCSRNHGHTWKIEVLVAGSKLDKLGMLLDFGILKEALKEILDEAFDHYDLNQTVFMKINPTAEHIASCLTKLLRHRLKKSLKAVNAKLEKVRVWESPKAYCEYF